MRSVEQPSIFRHEVNPDELLRKQSWAKAIEYCAELAGYDLDKQACAEVGMDRARWSRIKSGQEGIKPEQLERFMDGCGNDAPLLWLMHRRGWDVTSFRRQETEMERRLRLADERAERLAMEVDVLTKALTGRST